MNLLNKLSCFSVLMLTVISLTAAQVVAQDAKVIEMDGTDQLTFSKEEITVEPGQEVTIKLTTVSSMPAAAMSHNFVLLTTDADIDEVARKSARFADNEYIDPDSEDQIIAHTALAGGGETVEVTFTVPEETGEYPYICSFPGHFLGGMQGTMIVE